jgi:uncharacterized protein
VTGPTIVDTGPLVAFLNRQDQHHAWARAQMEVLDPPLLTCEAVLAEACHLLRQAPGGTDALLEMLAREVLQVPFRLGLELDRVRSLMKRYGDRPMALADACLVRMSEMNAGGRVLTLDKDFRVYRRFGRQAIPTLSPW